MTREAPLRDRAVVAGSKGEADYVRKKLRGTGAQVFSLQDSPRVATGVRVAVIELTRYAQAILASEESSALMTALLRQQAQAASGALAPTAPAMENQ